MPTPAQWREGSRLFCAAAEAEATPEIKRRLASHAHALAELAEAIERRERLDQFVRAENLRRYRQRTIGTLDKKRGRRSTAAG